MGGVVSVDPEIGRLAADPDVIGAIRILDCCFEAVADKKDLDSATAGLTREEILELCWRLLKRGLFRLHDDEVDEDDAPVVQETLTPGERARACVMGGKLFAVRQRLRRAAANSKPLR
jgi:hypothetical protein